MCWRHVYGTLATPQQLQSAIYGTYTALVYATPLMGGWLADRWFGRRYTVVVGGILMAIGHFMMAFENLFYFALLFIILGNGGFKPNISTQVGGLYKPGDSRIDRAYSIFYVGINTRLVPGPEYLRRVRRSPDVELWLRRRRRGHADRHCRLSVCAAHPARRPARQAAAAQAPRPPLTAQGLARGHHPVAAVHPQLPVLGDL